MALRLHRPAARLVNDFAEETFRWAAYGSATWLGTIVLKANVSTQLVLALGIPIGLVVMYLTLLAIDRWNSRDRIEIHVARWGIPGSWVDVKARLTQAITRTGIDVTADRGSLGDPARSERKVLLVLYTVDGADEPQFVECPENTRFTVMLR